MLANVTLDVCLLVLQWENKFWCLFAAHLVLFGELKGRSRARNYIDYSHMYTFPWVYSLSNHHRKTRWKETHYKKFQVHLLHSQSSLLFVILHRKPKCSISCTWCLNYNVALEIQRVDGFFGSGCCLRVTGTITKTFLHPTLNFRLMLKMQNLCLSEKVVSELQLWMNVCGVGPEHALPWVK